VAEELKAKPPSSTQSNVQRAVPKDEHHSHVEGLVSRSIVTWKDIGGLYEVKKLLAQNVAIAFAKKPQAIKPWKGTLLFGPPGTEKHYSLPRRQEA